MIFWKIVVCLSNAKVLIQDLSTYTFGNSYDCTQKPISVMKQILSVSSGYKDQRLVNLIKSVLVHKLIALTSKKRNLGEPSDIMVQSVTSYAEYLSEISHSNEKNDQPLSKMFQLNSIFQEVLTNLTTDDDSTNSTNNNQLSHSLDDLRLMNLLSSDYVDRIINSILQEVSLTYGKEITFTAQSPMKNALDAICNVSIQDDEAFCVIIDLLKYILTCKNEYSFACKKEEWDKKTSKLPANDCSEPMMILVEPYEDKQQLLVDSVLYNSIELLSYFINNMSSCRKSDLVLYQTEFINGYSTIGIYKISSYKRPKALPTIPLALVLQSKYSQCNFVVIIRGTTSTLEWEMNFYYPLKKIEKFQGSVHSGYDFVSAPLSEFVYKIISEYSQKNCKNVRLTLTGHSSGGAIAKLVAFYLSFYPKFSNINLVSYGVPSVFDSNAASKFNKQVNIKVKRNWKQEFDIIPKAPCSEFIGIPRCNFSHNYKRNNMSIFEYTSNFKNGINGYNFAGNEKRDFYVSDDSTINMKIPTSQLTKIMREFYEDSYGKLIVSLSEKKIIYDQFKMPTPLKFYMTHVCAYRCYFNHNACNNSDYCSQC